MQIQYKNISIKKLMERFRKFEPILKIIFLKNLKKSSKIYKNIKHIYIK